MKWRLCSAAALLCAAVGSTAALHAATLASMRAVLAIPGGQSCEVDAAFEVGSDRATTVMHRLLVDAASEGVSIAVTGAESEAPTRVGRTIAVPVHVQPGITSYRVRYRVPMPGRDRCPLLVPDAPTEGTSRAVSIDVRLAPGAQPLPGDFPAMAWSGDRAYAALAHVPAFVLVPHAPAGTPVGWWDRLETRRIVDAGALLLLATASVIWFSRKRGRA